MINIMRFLSFSREYSHMNIDKSTYKEFSTKQEAKEWGTLCYKEWKENYKNILSEMEYDHNKNNYYDVIEYYCGYTYREINDYLRSGKDSSESKFRREYADMLILLVYMAPRIKENIVLYRLVDQQFIENLLDKNGCATELGFVSTSLTSDIVMIKDEPYSSNNNILKIYVEKGTPGLYTPLFAGRVEEEMILPQNGRFQCISKPYYDNVLKKKVFECKIDYFGIMSMK